MILLSVLIGKLSLGQYEINQFYPLDLGLTTLLLFRTLMFNSTRNLYWHVSCTNVDC